LGPEISLLEAGSPVVSTVCLFELFLIVFVAVYLLSTQQLKALIS